MLTLGALGVVYGDIGTSPLYALKVALGSSSTTAAHEADVLGVLSLILWALVVVVSVKYVALVMRADNDGEGGVLALGALASRTRAGRRGALSLLALAGVALMVGDGMITPAISVLSATEGVAVAAPSTAALVVPAAAVILVSLFMVQRRGTGALGVLFGSTMLIWFATLAVLGTLRIVQEPEVLRAINPAFAVAFLADNGARGMIVVGAVFLVVTGGEALYADMGHFGRPAVRLGWFAIVLPALALCYLGQGALLITSPSAIANPFYLLGPAWAHWPMVILATGAAVIASQALISAVFSLTGQAINLGLSPRLSVRQTSRVLRGQVYVPAVNRLLMVAAVGLVVGFGSSSALAGAYGLAVAGTMTITVVLFAAVAHLDWGWSRRRVALVIGPLAVVDLGFLASNLIKIPAGGWFPLAIGAVVLTMLTTWRTGRRLVALRQRQGRHLASFVNDCWDDAPLRLQGVGIYLSRVPDVVPPALVANLRSHGAIHESVLVVTVTTERAPRIEEADRTDSTDLGSGIHRVVLHYGFAERPDVPTALARHVFPFLATDGESSTYFLGRESIEVSTRPGMARWRERLYALMYRNTSGVSQHLRLPHGQTVDVGVHVDI